MTLRYATQAPSAARAAGPPLGSAAVRVDARELLDAALPLAAQRMESYDGQVPVDELGEEAHLRPATVAALEEAARTLGLPVVLKTEHRFQTVDWESRWGVDIGIRGLPQLAPVFCELKWGDGASVLGECSWDLAKMGLAVAKSACSAAVLLAGAPQRRWTQPSLEGPELFRAGRHDLAHVRGPLYLKKYWAAYAGEGLPQPKRLPAAFETVSLPSQTMTLEGKVWELRCVQVLPVDSLVEVAPLPTS